jgi:Icc-related predicted phosphoesterase
MMLARRIGRTGWLLGLFTARKQTILRLMRSTFKGMRILLTSDLHGQLPDTPECDLLIVAGDICPFWSHDAAYQMGWLKADFSQWLRSRPGNPEIVGVAGNHDFAFERDRDLGRQLPWHYLKDSTVAIHGTRIYGTPWVPRFAHWAFQASYHQLDRIYDDVPSRTDIVVSHGPARGCCDLTMYGAHAGSVAALRMIQRIQPSLFVCGHIHEAHGTAERGRTLIVNVARRNIQPGQHNPMMMIEWDCGIRNSEWVLTDQQSGLQEVVPA